MNLDKSLKKKFARLKLTINSACLLLLAGMNFLPCAFASNDQPQAGSEGSLETMWKDQDAHQSKQADSVSHRELASPADSGSLGEGTRPAAAVSSASPADPPAARGASLEQFLHSHLIDGTTWPDIGPFKTTTPGPYSLIDASANKIGLAVEDNHVLACELDLAHKSGLNQNFVNLQMGIDFMLEALQGKDKDINEINQQLETDKGLQSTGLTSPVGFTSDHWVLTVDNCSHGDPNSGFKVRASSREAPGAESISIIMPDGVGQVVSPRNEETNILKAAQKKPTTKAQTLSKRSSEVVQPEGDVPKTHAEISADKYEKLLSAINQPDIPKSDRGLPGMRSEANKQEFLELLQNWQHLKKTAVRERQTTHLPDVLAGAALKRQSEAIKWLADNHKYFDMKPEGVQIERVEEQSPEKKYFVYAQVKEDSKCVDEPSGQVLKDSEATYHVRYTVEKSDERWVISDSVLVKPNPNQVSSPVLNQAQSAKSQQPAAQH